MIISIAVIVLAMILVVAPTGLCSYNPDGPEFAPVKEVDPQAFIDNEARGADYDIYLPDDPEGWVPNSARRAALDREPASRVGWVTPDGGFLQFTQTSVELDQALKAFDGQYRPHEETREIAGTTVTMLSSDDSQIRPLWGFEKGETTVLIDGAATDEEFETLTTAIVDAPAYEPAGS